MITDDTIVALSTPAGVGALAVIRLSGTEAIAVCDRIFSGHLESKPSHTLHYGNIMDDGKPVDEVMVGIYRSPKSFTRENVAEISCHGSPYIVQQVLQLLVKNGARPARPGEFTMRAFLNGRLDLLQAEAVADLVAAESASAQRAALHQMRGGFSKEIKHMRQDLIRFSALVELELDFAEEDVEFAGRNELRLLAEKLLGKVTSLKNSFELGNVIRQGVTTVIAGRPNAGKSTLLNALLNEDRAIVSEIPGTTRDSIEAVINLSGFLFRLVDTAGIREAGDVIEREGVLRTLDSIRRSALVVYLFDGNSLKADDVLRDLAELPAASVPVIPVANKMDVMNETIRNELESVPGMLFISAREQQNLHSLKERFVSLITQHRNLNDETVVTNARHAAALQKTSEALHDVLSGLENEISKELLASDIRRVTYALGEITGDITTDHLLEEIFSKFCIGK